MRFAKVHCRRFDPQTLPPTARWFRKQFQNGSSEQSSKEIEQLHADSTGRKKDNTLEKQVTHCVKFFEDAVMKGLNSADGPHIVDLAKSKAVKKT